MRKFDLVREKRDEILELSRKHGAAEIRIFGSVAVEQDSEQSDLDFLVRMEEGRNLFDFIGLWQDLEELLACKVDLVSERGLSPYLRASILEVARSL